MRYISVFNLFSEAEPFAAMLIAHGTHVFFFWGGLMRPEGPKFVAKGREWGRVLHEEATGFEAEPRPLVHFGPKAYKMRLVAADVGCSLIFLLSTGGPAEPLDTTGGTLRFRGTRVEKYCAT